MWNKYKHGLQRLSSSSKKNISKCRLNELCWLGLASYGYGIRYEFGIFKQNIVKGEQVPGWWLSSFLFDPGSTSVTWVEPVWPWFDQRDLGWTCVTLVPPAWPGLTLFDPGSPSVTWVDPVWPCLTLFDPVWLNSNPD